MVMELVEGITLKEYVHKKGKLSSKEVISIAIQMCTGIEAAHNHHIIHSNIKPQNIIISKEGKVKVTDFGIAKATTSRQSAPVQWDRYTMYLRSRAGAAIVMKSDILILQVSPCMRW